LQILSAVTKAQTFSISINGQFCGYRRRHPYVWEGESCEFRGAVETIINLFINLSLTLMGDLSENFSKLEIMCPCSCGADKISSVLIEKLKRSGTLLAYP